jgi:transcription elongation factor Elf1
MFGLFGKKEKQEKEQQEHPEFLKLVEKWDSFLEKMKTRFEESLLNAKEALLDNLEESNYDLGPTMVAWQGIKSQLMDLGNKVDTTFDEKVLPQMLEYKEHYDLLDEGAKGTYLREKIIFKKTDQFEIEIEGEISTRFYNHAVKDLNKDFHCTQCSAKLKVKKSVFHAHYVSCEYCNTVNTFTPNDKISQIRWVVDNIAKYNALEEWGLMVQAQNELKNLRPPHEGQDNTYYIDTFKKREDAERVFWIKYFTLRSEYLPDYIETIPSDVDNKMKWFYEERKRELNF